MFLFRNSLIISDNKIILQYTHTRTPTVWSTEILFIYFFQLYILCLATNFYHIFLTQSIFSLIDVFHIKHTQKRGKKEEISGFLHLWICVCACLCVYFTLLNLFHAICILKFYFIFLSNAMIKAFSLCFSFLFHPIGFFFCRCVRLYYFFHVFIFFNFFSKYTEWKQNNTS